MLCFEIDIKTRYSTSEIKHSLIMIYNCLKKAAKAVSVCVT